MKMKFLIALIAICGTFTAYGQETVLYPALKKQLDSMAFLDRSASREMISNGAKRDSLS